MESAKHLVSRWALDNAISDMRKERRKYPWRYLACASQLSTLQAERETVSESLQNANKRLVHLQTEGLHQLRRYARLSCRQLCDRVMKRLPREIRDLVYKSLLPWSTIEVASQEDLSYVWWNSSLRTKMNTYDYYWQLQFGTRRLPTHCLDDNHIGEDMLREIVATWDRITKFEVKVQALPHLLRSEHWQHDRTAATAVRNLAVIVTYPKHMCYNKPDDGCNSIFSWNPSLNQRLESLLCLERSAKVSILLAKSYSMLPDQETCEPYIQHEALLNCFAPIIGILQKLQDHGLRMEVVLVDKGCRLSGPEAKVSRELWKASLKAHAAGRNDC